jgi:hypothetical protein
LQSSTSRPELHGIAWHAFYRRLSKWEYSKEDWYIIEEEEERHRNEKKTNLTETSTIEPKGRASNSSMQQQVEV